MPRGIPATGKRIRRAGTTKTIAKRTYTRRAGAAAPGRPSRTTATTRNPRTTTAGRQKRISGEQLMERLNGIDNSLEQCLGMLRRLEQHLPSNVHAVHGISEEQQFRQTG